MFHSIMIPLDGSILSEQALAFAAGMAQSHDAHLTLVHVHHPSTSHPIFIEGLPVIDEDLHSLAADHERTYLELKAAPLRERGLVVDCRRLEGPTAPALAGFARSNAVNLIVLTTHGRSGFAHFWLGSIAEDLLRIAATPLLLLRPTPDESEGEYVPVRRILAALDGSATAEAILDPVEDLAQATRAQVVLLHVVPASHERLHPSDPVDTPKLAEQNGDAYLATVAGRLLKKGIATERVVAVSNHPAHAILEEAEGRTIDLIALATTGRGDRGSGLLGSVADKVLRGAHKPLLVACPRPD
jgi:nucleotide-binding universal stress UspA family protein